MLNDLSSILWVTDFYTNLTQLFEKCIPIHFKALLHKLPLSHTHTQKLLKLEVYYTYFTYEETKNQQLCNCPMFTQLVHGGPRFKLRYIRDFRIFLQIIFHFFLNAQLGYLSQPSMQLATAMKQSSNRWNVSEMVSDTIGSLVTIPPSTPLCLFPFPGDWDAIVFQDEFESKELKMAEVHHQLGSIELPCVRELLCQPEKPTYTVR